MVREDEEALDVQVPSPATRLSPTSLEQLIRKLTLTRWSRKPCSI